MDPHPVGLDTVGFVRILVAVTRVELYGENPTGEQIAEGVKAASNAMFA